MRHVGNDDLKYVCHSEHDAHHHRRNFEKVNVQNKQEFRNVCKHCKSYIHYVCLVGNDNLKYVCHSEHDAHHHRRNFEKVKMCKTNCKF